MQRQVGSALQDEPMALVVGRESILPMQVGGIDWRITEWDLIVVSVVQGLRERVCTMKLEVITEAVVDHGPDRVVVRVRRRLQVGDSFGSTRRRVEHRS